MIILDRKKIIFAVGIVTMFIITYMITGYNVNKSKGKKSIDVETVQTVALPVDSKVIILDARTRSA